MEKLDSLGEQAVGAVQQGRRAAACRAIARIGLSDLNAPTGRARGLMA
jgi:hypothetical protein